MDKKTISQKGFTLIEIVVILGVIAILVAILTPAVLKYLDDARNRRAEADVKQIAGAIIALMKDTGQYPGDFNSSKAFMVSDTTEARLPTGSLLGVGALTSSNIVSLADHLITNTQSYRSSGRFQWKGPYINELKPDPWNRPYVVNAGNLDKGSSGTFADYVFVISAGPDGVIDTNNSTHTVPQDDDIGVRIK